MILKRVHSFHHSFSYSLNHHPLKFHERKLDRKKVIKHSYSQNPICIYLTTYTLVSDLLDTYFDHFSVPILLSISYA